MIVSTEVKFYMIILCLCLCLALTLGPLSGLLLCPYADTNTNADTDTDTDTDININTDTGHGANVDDNPDSDPNSLSFSLSVSLLFDLSVQLLQCAINLPSGVSVIPVYAILLTICEEWKNCPDTVRTSGDENVQNVSSLRVLNTIYSSDCQESRGIDTDISGVEGDLRSSHSRLLKVSKAVRQLEGD